MYITQKGNHVVMNVLVAAVRQGSYTFSPQPEPATSVVKKQTNFCSYLMRQLQMLLAPAARYK